MTPDEYCADKVAKRGSSLSYATLRLPPEKRRAVVAVYAFRREVQDVAVECTDRALALVKLEWWRQQLTAIYGGTPEHPVARALQPVVEAFRLPEAQFNELIDGVQTDLDAAYYPDLEALTQYCNRTGVVPSRIAAEILGYQHSLTSHRVRSLSLAIEMSRILRDVGVDARRDRIYLPLEDLRRFAVEPENLLRRRHSDSLQKLIEFEIDRVEGLFAAILPTFPRIDRRAQRPLLALAEIARTILREIRADGCRVLERRISLTPVRKLWIAWRAPASA